MSRNFSLWARLLPRPGRKRPDPLDGLGRLAQHAADILTARLDAIEQRLDRIERRGLDQGAAPGAAVAIEPGQYAEIMRRLERLERLSHGGRGTYVGGNRVL